MRVKFIGTMTRVNSFGEFEPGKTYDVSKKTGEELLTVPELFQPVGSGVKKTATAENQVLDVTGEVETTEGKDYKAHTIKELTAMARERGLTTRRGQRKAEIIKLLEEADTEGEATDGDGESGDL